MNAKRFRTTSTLLLGISLFTLMFVSSAQAQRGELPTRDFSGTWQLFQENKFTVTMEVVQDRRGNISGKASYDAGRKGIARGTITGRASHERNYNGLGDVDHIEVEITWHNGAGIYKGNTPVGKSYLRGKTWPKGNPAGSVGWYTTQVFPRRR
jgi:hypothetical protein